MDTAAVSEAIVEVCARVILPRFRSLASEEIEQKRPGDLVTVADKQAEAELTRILGAATPGALVIGEETVFGSPGLVDGLPVAERAWVIDPVDGTRNFVAGSPDFGVMVAEVRGGVTVRGWIWQPLHERLYIAERGAGATLNGAQLPAMTPRRRPWRAGVWPRASRTGARGFRFEPTRGACAVDYPRLAQGSVDALAYRSVNPWDHLPGTLLVREVGGEAAVDGRRYAPGVTGHRLVVGASVEILEAVDAALPESALRPAGG